MMQREKMFEDLFCSDTIFEHDWEKDALNGQHSPLAPEEQGWGYPSTPQELQRRIENELSRR